MRRTVLVTGARGKTGREVARQLAVLPDVEVRAGSSQPGLAGHDQPGRAVRFDWHDPDTWPEASAGADAIYLMRPDLPDAEDLVAGLVGRNPTSHVVLLSEQSAEVLDDDQWVRRVENAVTERASSWTVLRPSWFQQVLTDPRYFRDSIRDDRLLSLTTGGAPIAWVDTRDIAAVAVAALLDPAAHHGQHHTLTGPEAVAVDELAQSLSAQVGERVTAVDPALSEALHGMEPWLTDILDGLYRRVREGAFAETTGAVETITGHPPRTVEDFISEHRAQWFPVMSNR
ncbi:MAG: NAD(P)H-binding protein [Actinobacteria bacterium]|nr:NAD(P)H-binding protein [Actinomycetota bacterium]